MWPWCLQPFPDGTPSMLTQQSRPLGRRGPFSRREVGSEALLLAQLWPTKAVLLLELKGWTAAGRHDRTTS